MNIRPILAKTKMCTPHRTVLNSPEHSSWCETIGQSQFQLSSCFQVLHPWAGLTKIRKSPPLCFQYPHYLATFSAMGRELTGRSHYWEEVCAIIWDLDRKWRNFFKTFLGGEIGRLWDLGWDTEETGTEWEKNVTDKGNAATVNLGKRQK